MIARSLLQTLIAATAAFFVAHQTRAQPPAPTEILRSDSRSPYVHRITLYDHDGRAISPRDRNAPPYSPARTCGKCHAYGAIHDGWHFNAGREGVDDGRPGEPWIYAHPQSGTQLPLSKRQWPGAHDPAAAEISDWRFLMRFGSHVPGGGVGAPDPAARDASDESFRWNISGTLEIDCLICHAASLQHDPAEVGRQLERENFKWAATVAAGLAIVRGDAKRLPDDFDPLAPPNPDFPERAAPRALYDASRFDADDRVLFDLTLRAPIERCYYCHSHRTVGKDAPPRWTVEQDVHLAAGLLCVDCHRNGIDHAIVRGYPGEPAAHGVADAQTFTCRGCHLGEGRLWDGPDGRGGRLGAPYPQHKGIPLIHFEKMTCTACHSGPWPQEDARRFQTSMAHKLGVAVRERTDLDPPTILGPIFARQEDGAIAPHRMIWPAYWGVEKDGVIAPLPMDRVGRAARAGQPREKQEHAPQPLTDDRIRQIAAELAKRAAEGETIVYVRDGRIHMVGSDEQLVSEPHAAAQPYLWPLAHDVRPASQSLGVRGCTDCHADGAPIYFGSLAAADEGETSARPVQRMHELHSANLAQVHAFNASFGLREAFKAVGIVCAGLIAIVLIRHALAGLGGRARRG